MKALWRGAGGRSARTADLGGTATTTQFTDAIVPRPIEQAMTQTSRSSVLSSRQPRLMDEHHRGRPRARGSRAVSGRQPRPDRRRPRASASSPTSTSCGRRSATSCIARSSIRSIRSCARSSASARTSAVAVDAARTASRRLRLEPSQPHRLSRRAAGPGRCGHPAADHRRRHQPVRRAARPDSQARHRRAADPPQHQGSGLPDHAQGLRRRAAAQARPVLLSGRRPQLQRRAEVVEDRACSARACTPTCRTWRSCRRRSPTTSCSRITSWRGRR